MIFGRANPTNPVANKVDNMIFENLNTASFFSNFFKASVSLTFSDKSSTKLLKGVLKASLPTSNSVVGSFSTCVPILSPMLLKISTPFIQKTAETMSSKALSLSSALPPRLYALYPRPPVTADSSRIVEAKAS